MARGSSYGSRSASRRVSGGGSTGGLAAPLNPSFSPNNITIKEEGTAVATQVSSINFVGPDITVTASGTDITVTETSSSGYTDEQAQDAIGTILTDTATIDFTYDDATPKITADVKSASITEAMQVLADNTTQDVTTSAHGYVPKAPNDTSKFLRGDATWATTGGGGGSTDANPFSDGGITKPAAADFSIADTTTAGHGTGAKANLSTRGVYFTNTRSTLAGTQSWFFKAATGNTFSQIVTYAQGWVVQDQNNWGWGIGARDNAGKIHSFGVRNGSNPTTWAEMRYTDINNVATIITTTGGAMVSARPIWYKVVNSGGNFVFSTSFDGENYLQVTSVSSTVFLSSTINEVGLFTFNILAASGNVVAIDLFSWAHT